MKRRRKKSNVDASLPKSRRLLSDWLTTCSSLKTSKNERSEDRGKMVSSTEKNARNSSLNISLPKTKKYQASNATDIDRGCNISIHTIGSSGNSQSTCAGISWESYEKQHISVSDMSVLRAKGRTIIARQHYTNVKLRRRGTKNNSAK